MIPSFERRRAGDQFPSAMRRTPDSGRAVGATVTTRRVRCTIRVGLFWVVIGGPPSRLVLRCGTRRGRYGPVRERGMNIGPVGGNVARTRETEEWRTGTSWPSAAAA